MVPHAQMRTVIVALATTGAWAGNASFLPQCTRPFRGDPGRYGIDAGGPEPADTCVAAVGVAKPVAKGIGSTSATPDAQSNHLPDDTSARGVAGSSNDVHIMHSADSWRLMTRCQWSQSEKMAQVCHSLGLAHAVARAPQGLYSFARRSTSLQQVDG